MMKQKTKEVYLVIQQQTKRKQDQWQNVGLFVDLYFNFGVHAKTMVVLHKPQCGVEFGCGAKFREIAERWSAHAKSEPETTKLKKK